MNTLTQSPSIPGTLRDLVALTKPRITFLVVATAAGGLWLAPGTRTLAGVLVVLASMAAVVSSANALNCWVEREGDALMARTRNRPLPAGRLSPTLALWFGLVLGAIAVPALAVLVNPLTGLLGAIALVSYVAIYTPMKRRSSLALVVGAVPGALPPLMGWTAATGRLDAPGLVLFAILFFWQMPHFLAITLFRKDEYGRAGIRVHPLVHGERSTRVHIALWAAALVPVTLLLGPLGVAGPVYLVTAAVLGAVFFGVSVRGLFANAPAGWPRRVFGVSLVYLTVLFAVLMLDAG